MFGFFKNKRTDFNSEVAKLLERHHVKIEKLEKELSSWAARAESGADILDLVNSRLAKLESLVNIPNPEDHNKPITTTEAILRVLNSNKRPLNFDEIFNSVKKYNLHVKEVSKASVKSTVYGLANKGKVGYGKEASTFKGIS